MKSSISWAFSLLLCLFTCLTACDNKAVVEGSFITKKDPVQKLSTKTGTVSISDSTGHTVSCPMNFRF